MDEVEAVETRLLAHLNIGGAEHPTVTATTSGFFSSTDKSTFDQHTDPFLDVSAHPDSTPSLAGYMSSSDHCKLQKTQAWAAFGWQSVSPRAEYDNTGTIIAPGAGEEWCGASSQMPIFRAILDTDGPAGPGGIHVPLRMILGDSNSAFIGVMITKIVISSIGKPLLRFVTGDYLGAFFSDSGKSLYNSGNLLIMAYTNG